MAADELDGVIADLETMHKYGAETWLQVGGGAKLARLAMQQRPRQLVKDEESESKACWSAVQEACQQLSDPYSQAALAYFGYGFHGPVHRGGPAVECAAETKSAQARKDAAAIILGVDVANFIRLVKRKFRVYGARHFESYEKLIVNVVADVLVARDHDVVVEPEIAPQDIHDAYLPVESAELQELGFFQRASTTQYVRDIASLATNSAVTIYAGSGVSADVDEPLLRSEFMARLLAKTLELAASRWDVAEEDRVGLADRISKRLAGSYPTFYLGSIVRELTRTRNSGVPRLATLGPQEEQLKHEIRVLLDTGYVPGSFLARAIAACAFALRSADASIEVITSHYDDILSIAAAHIRTPYYLPGNLESYQFKAEPDQDLAANEVRITHLNGTLDPAHAAIVIGEADFFADYDSELRPLNELSSWRHKTLADKLTNTTCIFVGSTLTDPDVLEHLARTKYRSRKYALILAPQTKGNDVTEDNIVHDLIAQRFLHLGVVPIIADHPHHIPQFLREIALCVLQGDEYKSYDERAKLWWDYWAKSFGFPKRSGPPSARSKELQEHWHTVPFTLALQRLQTQLTQAAATTRDNESILLEVWLRNPYGRELTLWGRSDSLWLDARTVHKASFRSRSYYAAQETFELGRAQRLHLKGKHNQWRFCWGIPLVLHKDPWYHLPVGVLNVLSDLEEDETERDDKVLRSARLMRASDPDRQGSEHVAKLEDRLRDVVLKQLDPKTSTWADGEPWEEFLARQQRRRR